MFRRYYPSAQETSPPESCLPRKLLALILVPWMGNPIKRPGLIVYRLPLIMQLICIQKDFACSRKIIDVACTRGVFWKLVVFAYSLLKHAPLSLTLVWRSMSVLVLHRYKIRTAVQLGYFERNCNEKITRTFVTKLSGRGLINRHLSQYVMNKFIRQNFTCPTSFKTLISRMF